MITSKLPAMRLRDSTEDTATAAWRSAPRSSLGLIVNLDLFDERGPDAELLEQQGKGTGSSQSFASKPLRMLREIAI